MKALKILFAVAMALTTVWSFRIPPSLNFQQPNLARILVWHLPCPMIASILLMVSAWFCLRFVVSRDRAWDERANASTELALLFCLLTMATGMLFSRVQWGAWWQWDPRQTSFLLVLLIYGAFFVLRGAFPDPERRAMSSAIYLLAALLPALFLIFIFPHLVDSMHPSNSIIGGQIKGEYAASLITMHVLMSILTVWLYRLRTRVGLLELAHEKSYE